MGIKERSRHRSRRIVANLTADFESAEQWDLDFWQSQTPEDRLSALIALRRDVEKVIKEVNVFLEGSADAGVST